MGWILTQQYFRENLKLGPGGETGPENDMLRQTTERIGANIMGKRMFDAASEVRATIEPAGQSHNHIGDVTMTIGRRCLVVFGVLAALLAFVSSASAATAGSQVFPPRLIVSRLGLRPQ